jgi:para-nitrobenzyl esterase
VSSRFANSIGPLVGIALALGLFVSICGARTETTSSAAIVRTREGTVQGISVGDVEQFRGVPFAAPPMGKLRWRAPLPPKPHPAGLDASKFPAPCMQGRALPDFPPPNEDCLYLNIYRPAGCREGKKLPVLVYYHGGGFANGTASARDGIELAGGNEMIVVMPNYRLGAFGWLSLPALDAETNNTSSGNYGFLDMVAALRWIQENIATFGGDKDNVTIAGTSAGGIGVCTLMTARMHERLFHKAIIESGECTRTSGFIISHQAALIRGAKFAAKAACTDAKTFGACLRSKPAAELLSASAGLDLSVANVGGSLMPTAPIDLIEVGDFVHIPVIVGANHDEQKHSPVETTGFPATAETYDKYLKTTFGPLAPLVAAEYPSREFSDPAYAAGAAASDSGVPNGIGFCPMLSELGGALSKMTHTYTYELDDPRGSGAPDSAGFEFGSMHTAEIGLLYAPITSGGKSPEQIALAKRMQKYWATFAREGRPHDGTNQWPTLQAGSENILRFQPTSDVILPLAKVREEHHCGFWSSLGY